MDKPKFNLLDGIIIFFIILIIAAGLFFAMSGSGETSTNTSQTKTAEFKIQLTNAEASLCDKFIKAMENGEYVWLGEKERFEAEIVEVSSSPSKTLTTNTSIGRVVVGENPLTYDIDITLKTRVNETDTAITASGSPLMVGVQTIIKGKGIAGYGYIISLKTLNL